MVTLGFEEKFAVRALVRRGLGIGDCVIALTGPIIGKVRKAIEYLGNFLKYFEGIEFNVIEVSEVYDFVDAVYKIKSIITKTLTKYERVYVNLSGGMRALVIEVLTATCLLPRELKLRVSIELDTEDDKATVEIPIELNLLINPPELGAKEKVLAEIVRSGELDIYTLAQKLGKDVTTLRRQIDFLKSLGLVKVTYRPLKVTAKNVAKLFI